MRLTATWLDGSLMTSFFWNPNHATNFCRDPKHAKNFCQAESSDVKNALRINDRLQQLFDETTAVCAAGECV